MEMADPISTAGSDPGSLLAAGRQAAGLSVHDVALRLKLSVDQINDLESGRFDKLGPTFSRGFVRSYARLLNMDADAIVRLLPSSSENQINISSQRIPLNHKNPRLWPWLAGVILLVALAAPWFAYRWMSSDDTMHANQPAVHASKTDSVAESASNNPTASPVNSTAVPALTAAPAIEPADQRSASPDGNSTAAGLTPTPDPATLQGSSPASAVAPLTPEPIRPVTATPANPVHEVSPASGPTIAAPAAAGNTPPVQTSNHLQLAFASDAWVSIHDQQNNVLTARIYHAGETATINFAGKAKVVIGNAAQVNASLNGQPINLAPWISVKVARLTLPLNP